MVATSQSHAPAAPPRDFKLVLLGEGGVGKSAITMQFVKHSFLEYHDPTIEDAYRQPAVIDGEPALLDILDTAGQVEFTAMRDQYMRGGEGFLLCYSITDRRSFHEIHEYKRQIDRVRIHARIPIILVGNKCDLNEHRKVKVEEGEDLARQYGWPFYETSAAWRRYVDEVFHELVRQIRLSESTSNEKRIPQKRFTRFLQRIRRLFHRSS